MFKSLRHKFDPLDREIMERAFHAAWLVIRENEPLIADKRLAAILHCKLIEIASTISLSDAEALRDIVLNCLPPAK